MSTNNLLDKARNTLADVSRDALAIALLEVEIGYQKLADYDRQANTIDNLRSILSTLERNLEELAAQLESKEQQITRLQTEYQTLQERKGSDIATSAVDERRALFDKLEPLAVQLPTLRHAVESGDDVSADDIVALLAPLDEALSDMGFAPIGKAGAKLKFDPTQHRAVGKGARSVEKGDTVQVRYVGYTHEGHIVRKAHVTAL